jgi:hypothetical protein
VKARQLPFIPTFEIVTTWIGSHARPSSVARNGKPQSPKLTAEEGWPAMRRVLFDMGDANHPMLKSWHGAAEISIENSMISLISVHKCLSDSAVLSPALNVSAASLKARRSSGV